MKKRNLFLSVLLVALCVALLALPAAAVEGVATGGTCGAGLGWTLGDDGTLTIFGSGAMSNYNSNNAPWVESRELITRIVIENSVTTIGNYAFYGCINATSVQFGTGVVTVGEYAFYNCTALTKIVVPETVATIGRGAFRGTSLEKITVPFVGNSMTANNNFAYIFETVPETLRDVVITKDTTIPNSAFEKLTLIETVTLPNGVETIGNSTFLDCTSLKRVNMGWESLRSIGNHAFNNCVALENVGCGDYVISIPETVITLGNYAFGSCQKFTSISVDMSGTIGEYAFASCIGATSITIGDKVTTIGNHAFYNMMITEIVVPENVTAIGVGAFRGCPLVSMTLPFVGNNITSEDGVAGVFGYIFNYVDKGTDGARTSTHEYTYQYYHYVSGSGNRFTCFYVPKTLRSVTITLDTTIPSQAFMNCDLIEKIVLPENVETINADAFYNCTALQSVDMGWETITGIGNNAFRNCPCLVRVGNAEKVISIPANVTTLGSYAFAGCTQFTTVTVDMVGTIGEGAFDGCINVTSITIGDEVTTINAYAFRNTMITEIVVPDNVTSIGVGAFQGCQLVSMILPFVGNTVTSEDGVAGVFGYIFNYVDNGTNGARTSTHEYTYQYYHYVSGSGNRFTCFYVPKTLRSVTITLDTTIPSQAFMNCDLIEKIVLPENVETINADAFYNCTALQSVDMGWETITGIGNNAFRNCPCLVRVGNAEKVISIPANVTTLGTYAFAGCTQFTTVTVDMVGTIGEGAFDGCTGVTSITIGDEVTTIGNYAFRNTIITEIVVPENVTSIGLGAFQGCQLVSMTLPFVGNTVTSEDGVAGVFGYIFNYVDKGTDGARTSTHEYTYQYYHYVSGSGNRFTCFYVPKTLRSVTITLDTTIPSQAFMNCDLIEKIVLPENVETINADAFYNCTALQSVDMGWETITGIGNNAFRNCPCLVRVGNAEKVISIPANVTTLGNYAFAGCTQFTTVTVDMVGTIGEGAFDGCINVTSITIGDEVTMIGAYAFRNAIITEMIVPNNVTSIGVGAFQGCPLVSITVPFVGTNVTAKGTSGVFGYIFGYFTGRGYGEIKTSQGKGYTYQYWADADHLYYIPETLRNVTITLDTTIPENAFVCCDLFEMITLPENVVHIDAGAFRSCVALKSVDMGCEHITGIGSGAFHYCSSLIRIGDVEKIISIPSSVTTLGTYAFAGCTQFTTVTVDMAGTIGEGAFDGCTGVTSITIGDKVTAINAYAFRNTKITEIVVPDSVTSIGSRVFEGCPLVSVTIPIIGDKIDGGNTFSYLFNGVPATLKNVTITMDTTIPNNAFKSCALLETITLPQGVETIGNEAFRGCTVLRSVDMGWDALTTIGEYAFAYCYALERIGDAEKIISIPSNVTTLGQYAFFHCDQIETAIINMTGQIGNNAFDNCDKLTSAHIGDLVTFIGHKTFINCKALASVSIADSVTRIVSYAFNGCSGLKHVLYKGTEEAWNAINIEGYNDELKNASRHYECSGNEVVDPVNNICQLCCEHVFAGQLQHADATCTEGSYDKKVCTICAYFEKLNETEPLGHKYTENKVPVTCTSQGYTLYECDQCGHSYIAGYTEVKGHNYNAVVTDPTCEKAGYTTHTCIDCGHSYADSPVEALGHLYQGVVTAPTCVAQGYTTYTCQTCHSSYQADYVAMSAHSYVGTVKAPTCTEKGYTSFLCSVCGHHYKGEYLDTIAHNYSETIIEPTCTKGGYTSHVCVDCGDSYQSDQLAALDHSYETVTVAPTCTDVGYNRHTCKDCGKTYDDAIVNALGHSYEVTVHEATCTEVGYTSYVCKACGYTDFDNYTEFAEHSFVTTVVPPTCTEVGYTYQMCTVCGEEVVKDETEMLAHDYASTVFAPTCTNEGYTLNVCNVCGEEYATEPIAMLPHEYTSVTVAPDCTQKGYTRHTCKSCSDSYDDAFVDAVGHSFTEATCTTAKYCSVCGMAEGTALGHNDVVTVVPASCTAGGYQMHLCDRCGNSYTDSNTAPLGHSYIYNVAQEPTASTAGSLSGVCSVCGDAVSVLLPALSEVDYSCVVEKQPTYLEEGVVCYVWKVTTYGNFLFRVNVPVLELSDAAKVYISNVHSNPGKTVDVLVKIQDAPALKSIAIQNLAYNAEYLTLIGVEWMVTGEIADWNAENGQGVFAFGQSSYINGDVLKLTFQVSETAQEETFEISLEVVLKDVVSGVELQIPVQVVQGGITVQHYIAGDVDGNGEVETDDAIYLLYHVMFGEEDYPVNQDCDFDGSGEVNTDDAIHLLYRVMFGEEEYPLH